MRRLQVLTLIALVGSLAGAGWVYAQHTNRPKVAALTAQDRSEIAELYARIDQGGDFREASLWLSAFSADAVFKIEPDQEYVGQKALTEWRAKSFGGRGGDSKSRHWDGSPLVTSTSDGGAKGRAYFVVF